MKKKLLVLILVATSVLAKSGNEVGNGGDVVTCLSLKNIESVQLFDFFEFSNRKDGIIKESKESKDQIMMSIITQLKIHDDKLAQLLMNRSKEFLNNVQFVTSGTLVNINDSDNLITPIEKCKIEQVAILKKKVLFNDKKFLVDERIWNKLNETQKAGLIFHELIYEYFADLGEKNSVNVRALNSFLFSDKLSVISSTDYWKFIQSMKIPHYTY